MKNKADDPGPCPVAVMWNDYLNVLEPHVPAHTVAQQKDAFYSAVGKVIYELLQHKDDPKMVGLALRRWLKEQEIYLDEVLSQPDFYVPVDPSRN